MTPGDPDRAQHEAIDRVLDAPGRVLLLGGMDSGKTTFARHLLAAALERGLPAAFLDTDVDRSTVGPPTTLGLKIVREPADLEPDRLVRADGLYFAGWISARFHLLPVVTGTVRLLQQLAADADPPRLVVVDTSSLIAGVYGQLLKFHKMEATRPDHVIGFQRGEELEPLLGIARRFTDAQVTALPVHPDIRPVDVMERVQERRSKLAAYFAEPLHRWRVKPSVFMPSLPPETSPSTVAGLLVGLEDGHGRCLGIGHLELAEDGGLRLRAPVSEGAKALRLGSARVQPDWSSATLVDLRHLFGTD